MTNHKPSSELGGKVGHVSPLPRTEGDVDFDIVAPQFLPARCACNRAAGVVHDGHVRTGILFVVTPEKEASACAQLTSEGLGHGET